MNQIVHREACNEERKGSIDSMGPSNGKPCRSEALSGLPAVWMILGMPFGATKGTFRLVSSGKFDDVGNEEMARNEEVENRTKNYVLSAIIMAAYTYENSILEILSGHNNQGIQVTSLTFMKFSTTSRRFITTVRALGQPILRISCKSRGF